MNDENKDEPMQNKKVPGISNEDEPGSTAKSGSVDNDAFAIGNYFIEDWAHRTRRGGLNRFPRQFPVGGPGQAGAHPLGFFGTSEPNSGEPKPAPRARTGNDEAREMSLLEWRDPGLDPELRVGFSRFYAEDGNLGYDVHVSPAFPAWYRIEPHAEGWSLLAFTHGEDTPCLCLTDTPALRRLKDNPTNSALAEMIALVAVFIVERTEPWVLDRDPVSEDFHEVERLRRRWKTWARAVPVTMLAAYY